MIEAYQAIDILMGADNVTIPPEPGYVVTFPDSALDAVMLKEPEATEELLIKLKAKSKYPDHIFYRPCWIHEQGVVFGEKHNRKHWTPR